MSGQALEGDAPAELSNMVAISSMEVRLRELGEVIDGAVVDGGLRPDVPPAAGSSLSSLRSAGALPDFMSGGPRPLVARDYPSLFDPRLGGAAGGRHVMFAPPAADGYERKFPGVCPVATAASR